MTQGQQERRFAVNVYLFKKDVGSPGDVIDFSGLNSSISIPLSPDGLRGQLHYGQTSGPPDWLLRLFHMSDSSLPLPQGASISGLLPVSVGERHFVLTFGHAWHKLKTQLIEANFGIRCVLNLAEEEALTSIRRDRIAEDSLQAIEQIPDSDSISRFGMDLEKDLLRGVKANIKPDLGFGPWVAGADSFKTSIDLSKESFASFLSRCLDLFSKDVYKARFEWIDNIKPIRDEELIPAIEEKLAKLVAAKSSGISMSAPDLLAWDEHDYFSFERKKKSQSPCANHLNINQWVAHAALHKIKINVDALHNQYIYAFSHGDVNYSRWPLIECLHSVVSYEDRLFLTHAGQWFELSKNFVEDIEKRVANVSISKLTLPPTTMSEKEGDYNVRVSSESGGALLRLDKKLIWHGGKQSKVEVCDLFSENGQLICVKPWGGASGSLSHLFSQAKVAITLINNDEAFVSKVREKIASIDEAFVDSWDYICKNTDESEVVLAVMRGCKKEDLPIFAKLALCECISSLRAMRFSASYLVIDEV